MKYLSAIFTIILFTGCSDSNNNPNNINSPLLGKWETQSCQQLVDSSNNPPITTWSKATYEFLLDGGIMFSPNNYTDANCTTIAFNTLSPSSPIAFFQDLGSTTLEEGIPGHKLNIEIRAPDQTISTDGFYTINNNILCFSHSYSFEPSSFGISLIERTPIDFTSCLVPVNEP